MTVNLPAPTTVLLGVFAALLSTILPVAAATFLLFWVTGKLVYSLARKLPYPPGPPSRDFISGNARDLTESRLWFPLAEWATIYGPIFHLRILNKHMIVLNSVEDAIELMEKRSNNYSDRPYTPMTDLIGWTFSAPFMRYGPEWQRQRRLLQQTFKRTTSLKYRPAQVEKVNDMLNSLLETPDEFLTHIKTLSAAIVMSTMYGYKVSPKNDPFQEIAETAVLALSNSLHPAASIVNFLPFMRYFPAWFPGAGFHHVAKIALDTVTELKEVPYEYVRDSIAAGTASPSFVAGLIETCKTEQDHELLKIVAATGYAAGADTTTSSLGTFFYAMATFPEVQKKAQAELDRVIGHDRLVDYDDEDSLPYIQALCREVFRWRPVTPLGNFHASMAADVYKGYYIPKGCTIVPNIWAMSRNPVRYPNPEDFNPDRFFTEHGKLNSDEVTFIFGFGRRICPGRHMAFATVWLAVATILSTFDIRLSKDASGKDVPLIVEYTGGLISHPLPFECSITPRSKKTKQLIIDLTAIKIE